MVLDDEAIRGTPYRSRGASTCFIRRAERQERMEPSLARYIWTHTWRQQLYIVLIVALSMIPYFMSFDLPKQIVNGPIQGKGFEQPGSTQPFMAIDNRRAADRQRASLRRHP